MNREAWQHNVHEARTGNDALWSKAITSNFEEHFYTAVKKAVHDEALTSKLYNFTLLIFWKRVIRMGEDLPES